jgi:twitching motility protein PilI
VAFGQFFAMKEAAIQRSAAMDAGPYEQLVEMAIRSQEVASPLPPKADAQSHWRGVGFSLLGQRFVAPMNDVAELARVPTSTRLPGVKSFVIGIASVRGRLMAILDLAMFFSHSSHLPRAQRRVLVIESDEYYFGYLVDESLGMQHFPSESFSETVEDVDEMFKPFLEGSYQVAGTVWPVLSFAKLIADPVFEKLSV